MRRDSPGRSSGSWWSWGWLGWRRRGGSGARSVPGAVGGRWPGSASRARGRSCRRQTSPWGIWRTRRSTNPSPPSRPWLTRCQTTPFQPGTSPWRERSPSGTGASNRTRKPFKQRRGRSTRWSAGRGHRPIISGSRPASPRWPATPEPGRRSRAGLSWRPPTTRRPGTSAGSRFARAPAARWPAEALGEAEARREAPASWPRRSTGPANSIRGISGS